MLLLILILSKIVLEKSIILYIAFLLGSMGTGSTNGMSLMKSEKNMICGFRFTAHRTEYLLNYVFR